MLAVPTAYTDVLERVVYDICVTDEKNVEMAKHTMKFGADKYVVSKYGRVIGECVEEEDHGKMSTSISKAIALRSLA